MKVFDVVSPYGTSSVVAKDMGGAERVFMKHYWPTTIKEIRLHSDHVLVDTPQDRIDRATVDGVIDGLESEVLRTGGGDER